MIQVSNLKSDALARAIEMGSSLFHWWINELVQTFPASRRLQTSNQRSAKVVRLRNDTVQLQNRGSAPESWEPVDHPSEASAARPLVAALLLPSGVVLRRLIELPSAAAPSLHEAASFQIGRLTPFRTDDVYHLARVLGRDKARKMLKVELVVVPRRSVHDAISKLASHHIEPHAILVEGDSDNPALDFASHCIPRKRTTSAFGMRLLLILSILLLVGGPFGTAYRVHLLAADARAQAAAAAAVARRTMNAETQLEELQRTEAFLPSRLQQPHAVETLDALSRLVPDSSWIFRLELRGNEIAMSGLSSDLPALLQSLAQPPFTTPELTSPVVQGLANGQTRFDLRLSYRSGA